MAHLQSSQKFVRALKAPTDPPSGAGPTKFEIAREAWDTPCFRAPNKEEVITEWILGKFAKERSRSLKGNPLVDLDHWNLLSDIITPSKNVSQAASHTRPVKIWLVPLIHRTSFASTVTAYLGLSVGLDIATKSTLDHSFYRCLQSLWPLAAPKLSTETTLDIFGASLDSLRASSLQQPQNLDPSGSIKICSMITSCYRSSLSNASNRKKVQAAFITQHLSKWVQVTTLPPHPVFESIEADVYAAGSETLFSAEALRSMREGKLEAGLFGTLEGILPSSPASVLAMLPRLFTSFIQASRKYRSVITAQAQQDLPGDAIEHLRKAAVDFCSACLSCAAQLDDHESPWRARVALLDIVDRERLFNYQDADTETMLKNTAGIAYKCLASPESNSLTAQHFALQSLATLTRIDYDLVAPILPQLLRQMLLMDARLGPPTQTLLGLLLEYHSKTRTMPDYVLSLFSALPSEGVCLSAKITYETILASPVLSVIHLDRLSKAANSFTTPSQVLELCAEILAAMQTVLDKPQTVLMDSVTDVDGPRKKRKTSETTSTTITGDQDVSAIIVSLVARIASVVIPALPFKTIERSSQNELREQISSFCSSVVQSTLKHAFKTIRTSSKRTDTWKWQVITSALLRFQYTLAATPHPIVSVDRERHCKLDERILKVVASDDITPELAVTGFHYLLRFMMPESPLAPSLVDTIFMWLERSLPSQATWSGLLCDLPAGEGGRATATVAILHILLSRWLATIESIATEVQLKRLMHILLSIQPSSAMVDCRLQASDVLTHALQSAGFWELPKIRDAILNVIAARTGGFEGLDMNAVLGNVDRQAVVTTEQATAFIATCEFLLHTPADYLPRQVQAEMVGKALLADILILSKLGHQNETSVIRAITVLRAFLLRTSVHSEAIEHIAILDALKHFTSNLGIPSVLQEALTSLTTELVGRYFKVLLHAAQGGDDGMLHFVEHVSALCFSGRRNSRDAAPAALLRLLLQMIDILVEEISSAKFPSTITAALIALHRKLLKRIRPMLDDFANQTLSSDVDYLPVNAWRRVIMLGRWLQLDTEKVDYGQTMAARLAGLPEGVRSLQGPQAILALLVEELRSSLPELRIGKLERLLACNLLFLRVATDREQTRQAFASLTTKTWKSLSVQEYAHILALVTDAIAGADPTSLDLPNLLGLSGQLLHDAPEGTLKVTQNHVSQCLSLVVNKPEIWLTRPDQRLGVLDLLVRQCSDRPTSLRSVDMHTIISLISHLLAASSTHDSETSLATYHSLVSILSALVRLRRDLLTPLLPHVSDLLRQLLLSLRQPRPQLGGKQTRMVTDTLPAWIGAGGAPLGATEARALARLLTALTAKTVVRSFGARDVTSEQAPAASLARAFSKHAAPVLRAYVDARADPLCVLAADVRRELEPGLFALCEMTSEHVRDAMVTSALDAGGKMVLKALWREYEQQRYVGKG